MRLAASARWGAAWSLVTAVIAAGCAEDSRPPPAFIWTAGGLGGASTSAGDSGGEPGDGGSAGAEASGSLGVGETSTATATTSTTTTTTTSTTTTTTTTTTPSGSASGSSSGGGQMGVFGPPEVFGDDLAEVNLIGSWGAPTYGNPLAWELALDISDQGSFVWIEYDDACQPTFVAYGVLWVSGSQLVLHYEALPGGPPWDTAAAIGETFAAPFRVKLGFAPMGTYLGLAAPEGLTRAQPWDGRAYDRQQAGLGPQGSWVSEAELEAIPAGELEPALIVRDRFEAELLAGGGGLMTHRRTYWWPDIVVLPPTFTDAPWVDGTPGNPAGAATIGGRPYAYDPLHLITFGQWDALRLDPQLRCG